MYIYCTPFLDEMVEGEDLRENLQLPEEGFEPREFSEGADREMMRFEMALLIGGERTQEKLRETEREFESADSLDLSLSSLAAARATAGGPGAGGPALSRVPTASSSASINSAGSSASHGTLTSRLRGRREASWSSFYERFEEDPEQLARLARIRQRTRDFVNGRQRASEKQRAAAAAAATATAANSAAAAEAPPPV